MCWRRLALVALPILASGEEPAAPARSRLVVSPADGSRLLVAEAGAATADVALMLDREYAQICVTTRLGGAASPSPEACLSGAASIHVSNVPLGAHAFAIRDGARTEAVKIVVAPRPEGVFVPTYDWRATGDARVERGLEVRLPLDGAPKTARIPDVWRLQLWASPPTRAPGFWRVDVTAATTASALENDLARWARAPRARLALDGAANTLHPNATAAALDLFAHRQRLVARFDRPDDAPPARPAPARPAPAAEAPSPPAREEAPLPPPPPPRRWAGGGPLRVVRPPAS
jgi:hypothetical protein